MRRIPKLNIAIGHVFFAHRRRLGLNTEELALKVGGSESYVKLLESGKRNPTFSVFLLYAEAFEIDPHELLSDISQRLTLLNNKK